MVWRKKKIGHKNKYILPLLRSLLCKPRNWDNNLAIQKPTTEAEQFWGNIIGKIQSNAYGKGSAAKKNGTILCSVLVKITINKIFCGLILMSCKHQ